MIRLLFRFISPPESPPPETEPFGNLLLSDGSSFLVLNDGTSKVVLAEVP